MQIAFLQYLTDRRTSFDAFKEHIKQKVTGGASITGSTLENALGRPMHLILDVKQLRRAEFNLAAISFNTPGAPRAYQAANRLKALGKTVIAGGPHPSVLPGEALKYVDAVCIGAGDVQFPKMVKDAECGKLKRLYRGSIGDWVNPKRKMSRGLSLVQLSRGCPHNCVFCVVSNVYPGGVDEKPIELVSEELKQTSSTLSIVDDNFFVNTWRSRHVLDLLGNANKRFICQVSVDTALDRKNLEHLARAGCTFVVVGLESINPQSLEFLGKSRIKDPREVVWRIHDAGMGCYLNMVFGSDGETPDIFEKTMNFFDKTRPDLVSPHILTPMPGTRLYDNFAKQNRLLFDPSKSPRAWSFFDSKHVTFIPDPMRPAELAAHYKAFEKSLFSLHKTIRRVPKNSLGIALLSSILKNEW